VTAGPAASDLGLAPRPVPDAAVLAAIAAAVDEAWPKSVQPALSRGGDWRFSGRWWVRPVPFRRERPFTR
jgi:hypothetical protein